MMTASGWIRNGAVSEVESKVRQKRTFSLESAARLDWRYLERGNKFGQLIRGFSPAIMKAHFFMLLSVRDVPVLNPG